MKQSLEIAMSFTFGSFLAMTFFYVVHHMKKIKWKVKRKT